MLKKSNPSEKNVYNTIISRRSIRRFTQQPVSVELLKEFVNAARLAPSAANLQPLQYILITEKNLCDQIFETLGWAAYLTPKWIPDLKERPTGYIIVLSTDSTNKYYQRDVGFATENIIIAAEAENIGSCILCNIDKQKIREILQIPDSIEIDSVIALGYKAEQPIVEELHDSVKYWRDKEGILHIPKRSLKDIIHINRF